MLLQDKIIEFCKSEGIQVVRGKVNVRYTERIRLFIRYQNKIEKSKRKNKIHGVSKIVVDVMRNLK